MNVYTKINCGQTVNEIGTTLMTDKDIRRQDIMNVPVAILLERIGHGVLFTRHGAHLHEMNTLITERKYVMTGKKCLL